MNENFEIEIQSYFNSLPRNNSYFDILVSSPSPVQKRTLGRLIIISKLDSKIQTKNLVNIINENIRSNYYANLNANIEFAIENTLIDFNNKIEDIEKIEKIKNFSDSFSSIIIIIRGNDIYFTQHGATDILLLNKGKVINIGEDNKNNGDRIFSDIVIGKIYKNNTLLFGTKSLFNYVSIDKITNHLQNSNIENTIEFIEKSLDAKGEVSDSVGIVIVGQNKNIQEQNNLPFIAKNDSILEKIEAPVEKAIDQIKDLDKEDIIESVTPVLDKGANTINKLKDKIANYITNISNSDSIKKIWSNAKHTLKTGAVKFANFIVINAKVGAKKATNALKKLPSTTVEKAKIIEEDIKQEPIDVKINKKIDKSKNWFKNLETSKKIFLIALIVLAIMLIFILRIYQINKATKTENSEYQTSVETIKSLQNEASSALMYNNVSKAQDLISEADYLISKLKTDSKTRKDTQTQLLAENKNILNKVYKTNDITNPTLLNDFSSVQGQEKINTNKILELNNKLFAFDYQNKSIYSFSKDGIEKLNIQLDIGTILACNNVTTEKNNILIVDSNKKLYLFDGTKITNIDIGDKLKNYNIDDISSYDSNIYLVDKTNGKVLSIRKTNNKYGTPTSWLKDQFNFNTYSSISIDGYIYLASSGGTIKKYLKGYEKTFNLDTINPKLDHIDKIYTDENTDKIYILDKSQNRLLVFNKNNVSLVAQYKSTEFDNLQDFIIDTKNNKAYLLNGTKVFEVIF